MDICIMCSAGIKSKEWIETQIIECLYELFEIDKVLLGQGNFGEEVLSKMLGAKYPMELFPYSWEEFGIGAVHRRNIEMLAKSQFLLALHDGSSRSVDHGINIALRKKIPFNVRYFSLNE